VQVKSPGRLDIEVAGASIYSLVVETGAGVDLDQPLATNVAVFGTTNILTGAYQNAAYPTFIGSTSTLNVSNSLVSLSGPTTFCTGNSLTLTASSGASYIWKNNTTQVGTAAAYTSTVAGSYIVDATSAAGCKVSSAPVVTFESTSTIPTITATATSFCTGGSAVLTASTGASYKWSNGTTQVGTSSAYTVTTAGTYTVEVTNATGCKATSAPTAITVTSTIAWYADTDNDGIGDIATTLNACTKPNGYVAISGDDCPTDISKTTPGNCGCGHTETSCLDCAGTPHGTAFFDNCSICVGGTTGNTACLTTATVNTASSTGILSTYPQPFTNALTISLKNKNIKTVTFFNSQGLIIEYRHDINADEILMGESLPSGIYFIVIESETEVYTSKVIKY